MQQNKGYKAMMGKIVYITGDDMDNNRKKSDKQIFIRM